MTEDAAEKAHKDLRRIERAIAMTQLGDLRHELRVIGSDLRTKGDCILDEDAVGILAIAAEIDRLAVKLRAVAVQLNSATLTVGAAIAEEARERGHYI